MVSSNNTFRYAIINHPTKGGIIMRYRIGKPNGLCYYVERDVTVIEEVKTYYFRSDNIELPKALATLWQSSDFRRIFG